MKKDKLLLFIRVLTLLNMTIGYFVSDYGLILLNGFIYLGVKDDV